MVTYKVRRASLGVIGSLGAPADVACPCAEGQGQQRRVCVTKEWMAQESGRKSVESAEHTQIRRENEEL